MAKLGKMANTPNRAFYYDYSIELPGMNYGLLITGSVPPLLAIIAELLNPVSKDALRPGVEEAAGGLAFKPQKGELVKIGSAQIPIQTEDDIVRETQRRASLIANAMNRIATAAVEVAGVIPTWIGVTSGMVTVLVEIIDPLALAIITVIWIGISAGLGVYYFSRIKYWNLAHSTRCKLPFKRNELNRQERLSLLLIGANLLVILVALFVAAFFATPPSSESTDGHHSDRIQTTHIRTT